MDLIGMLRSWLGMADYSDVAAEIAARCRTAAWERTGQRAQGMSLAEARGYVRVRVAHLVREEVDAAIRQANNLKADSRKHLEELAMEGVLRQAILDLLNARKLTHAAARESVARAA
jgi:hypothetical protein